MRRLIIILLSVTFIFIINLTIMPSLSQRHRDLKKEYIKLFLSPSLEKWSAFEWRIMKGFFHTVNLRVYLGKLREETPVLPPEAETVIVKTTEVVSCINPHYYDIYYLANGFLTWDFGNVEMANKFLFKAIKYRPRDWFFYFLLGFNYFYFLRDYKKGGFYIKKAAEIRRSPFLSSLAARLMYASGRTEVAIQILRSMIRNAKEEGWKKSLTKRLKALERVMVIEKAVEQYRLKFYKNPHDINELVDKGLLKEIPEDPYGGIFYLDENGIVKSTSNFTERFQRTP